ncbi:hypothetical protein AAF712_015815 [Marasmius tenuissimus]|uniref:DEAD/DEAH-box helicase domain-containing protein n=1 Tax=Marasmius tenuissimus TaxID=585030 RepID=A0ABR2Z8H7_9AGAR
MSARISFRSSQGASTLDSIVQKSVPQWPNGLRSFQRQSILKILNQQQLLCITATGDGKSALFAIPILVHREIGRNPKEYPQFNVEIRRKPAGLVVIPTKGLANNIVTEMGYLDLSAFAYTHDNITRAQKSGINITEKITDCDYNIVCVDPAPENMYIDSDES